MSSTDATVQVPVSRNRVITALMPYVEGFVGSSTTDGHWEASGGYGNYTYHLRLLGEHEEILTLSITWNQVFHETDTPRLLAALNACHKQFMPWPAASVWPARGGVVVRAFNTMDYELGVSDQQLNRHVEAAIGLAQRLFTLLEGELLR